MALEDSAIEQAELLFCQRLALVNDRYTGFGQLKQHDYRLLDCLQVLTQIQRQTASPGPMPCWLKWLTETTVPDTAPSIDTLSAFTSQEHARQLMLDIKLCQQPVQFSRVIEELAMNNGTDAFCLWHFAARQQLPVDDKALASLQIDNICAQAIFYLGCSGDRNKLALLQKWQLMLSQDDRRFGVIQLAGFMLGQDTDVAALVIRLLHTSMLTDMALMLLMANASAVKQMQIINYLSAAEGQTLMAIRSMAFSGQLKFVPLLLELSQQPNSTAAALDALTLILGVMDTDELVSAADTASVLSGNSKRKLAGYELNEQQMPVVWRWGNTAQRQLIACYRFLSNPGAALVFTDRLTQKVGNGG